MRNLLKKTLLVCMSLMLIFTCVACGDKNDTASKNTENKNTEAETPAVEDFEGVSLDDGKAGDIYSITISSGEEYDATVMPEAHFLGATQAYSGMRVGGIVIQVKFYEDGTYKYVATDYSAVDTSDERWMHREYVWTGTYTVEENVYTLAVPTTATLEFRGGKAYPPMADMIGELGSFTHETNPELLTMFEEATATVDGETITFALVNASAEDAGPQGNQIRIACVGDSITFGHGVANWETDNYPALLQTLLGEEYYVGNYGFIGACVNPNGDKPYTEQSVYQESLELDADILIFMLGTNDSKAENWTDEETFFNDYVNLLKTYVENGNVSKIYIGLCAESYDIENPSMEYGIQPEIVDKIVEKIYTNMKESDLEVEIVDIHSLTEAHPEWFEDDGVHPNTEGAKAIAEAFAEAIQ